MCINPTTRWIFLLGIALGIGVCLPRKREKGTPLARTVEEAAKQLGLA